MSAYDKTSIQINRCKRILALVDDYVEKQTAATRTDLRKALMNEFEVQGDAIAYGDLFDVVRGTGYVTTRQAREICEKVIAAIAAKAPVK